MACAVIPGTYIKLQGQVWLASIYGGFPILGADLALPTRPVLAFLCVPGITTHAMMAKAMYVGFTLDIHMHVGLACRLIGAQPSPCKKNMTL